ncbi:hypothetical protein [Frankia sp. ACN1ag]|uniref:hypothetical protein n=1 Tax=Frankia sp. ACN1ag TaxID=102891 RepID=UPI000B13B2D2|nr:hypothetical protein [Frankia sp. ACN1ag]
MTDPSHPQPDDQHGSAGTTGPAQPRGEANPSQSLSLLERLAPILSTRIAQEMPEVDPAVIEQVAGRVLGLLAGSARVNQTRPLADATLWFLTHVLEDPERHRAALAAVRWELPGLTIEDFARDAAFVRTPGHEDEPPGDHPAHRGPRQ